MDCFSSSAVVKGGNMGGRIKQVGKRKIFNISLLHLLAKALLLAGCSGGGGQGVSSEVVSGVAAVGAALSGEVKIKDATEREKTAVIGSDGSFAFDVSDMQAPYILRAVGTAGGESHILESFSEGKGTANINPFTHAAVASAGEVDDPAKVYDKPDRERLNRIKIRMPGTIEELLTTLQPLLERYDAEGDDPFKVKFVVDRTRLDGLFHDVQITLYQGILTIINKKTKAVIYTGNINDIKNGDFFEDNIPDPGSLPDAPAGLTAAGGNGQTTISWSSVGNATSYNIYWSLASGVTKANGAKVAGAASPFTHTGLTAGTAYYYIVTAVNSAGESAASTEASATTNNAPAPTPTVPAAPTGVVATGGTKQVSVSWPAVTGATSYNIYWSTSTGVTKTGGTKIADVTSPSVHIGLADSTTYYYIVTAVNSVGEGAASVQVAATTLTPAPAPSAPAAPTGVSAAGGAGQATISWSPVSGAASYNIYWSAASGVATATGTRIAGVSSPYVQTGLAAGTTYYYIVTAVNSVGESGPSAQASATTNPPPPALPNAPGGVNAVGGANQVTISWTAASGATSYNIYWSTTSGVTTAGGTRITGAASPYVQTGLAAGTTYYYIVTGVNSAGEGAPSSQASAATDAALPAVPSAPTGVSAVGGANQVTVSWSLVLGAASYNIYWSTSPGVTTAGGTRIGNAASPYVQTGLADNTAYYYIVTALNASGESAASSQAMATTSAPAPPPLACGTCHAIPPATGRHAFHVTTRSISCDLCHGSGYSSTTVNAATHINGLINLATSINWNAANRTCAPACHALKSW